MAPSPAAHAVLVAAISLAFAVRADAGWPPAAAGSWVVVEAWKHGLADEKVTRTTTRLVRWQNGAPWFEHMDESGRRWEDADGDTAGDWNAGQEGGTDTFVTRQVLVVDGVKTPCRVIERESRTEPWSPGDPVSAWVAKTKRWEAIDPKCRVRVLKTLDLGTATHYRDGRVEEHPGLTTRIVKSLHETIRQHGRDYDCWVVITKTSTEQGGFAGRTTVWGSELSPTGWVRRIRETRDPRNNAMARFQEQVVDYRVR